MYETSNLHHSFDVACAEEYKSIDLAILIHHFQYWILKNKRLNRNLHEGRTWTYQTIREIAANFPYWSVKQVERILEKAVKQKILLKKNFNKKKYDRTSWYAFQNEEKFSISRFREMEIPESGNGDPEIGKPIPDTIPNTIPNKSNVSEPAVGLTDFFLKKLQEINPKIKKPNMIKWTQEMYLIMNTDGRSEAEIREIIEYIVFQHKNPKKDFTWSKAVASPQKLRQHFASIWLEMSSTSNPEAKQKEDQKKVDVVKENRKWATQVYEKIQSKIPNHIRVTVSDTTMYIANRDRKYESHIPYANISFKEEISKFLRNNNLWSS